MCRSFSSQYSFVDCRGIFLALFVSERLPVLLSRFNSAIASEVFAPNGFSHLRQWHMGTSVHETLFLEHGHLFRQEPDSALLNSPHRHGFSFFPTNVCPSGFSQCRHLHIEVHCVFDLKHGHLVDWHREVLDLCPRPHLQPPDFSFSEPASVKK